MKVPARTLTRTSFLVSLTIISSGIATAETYEQNFDAFPNGTTDLGDGTVIFGQAASVQNGRLQLTIDNQGLGFSSFTIPALQDSSRGWTATWDYELFDSVGGNPPADGFSFNYGDFALGEQGAAEEGWANGVNGSASIVQTAVSFEVDTWQNFDAEQGVNISGVISGQDAGNFSFTNGPILDDGASVQGTMTASYDAENETVSFTTTGLNTNADFIDVPLPAGISGNDLFNFGFSARVGGANQDFFIDNLVITAGDFDPEVDTDGDGLPDGYEERYFPGDLTQLGIGDFDGDTVNDPAEYLNGTDPTAPDSDDDGSDDGAEATAGTDPLDEDSDNDGLLDGVETGTGIFVDANNTGTDPLNNDTDGDLTFDGQEVDSGFDPNDPASAPEISLANHVPERVLYRRTDNLPAADFTGALPENVDQLAPFGELDQPDSFIIEGIDVDREPGGLGTDLLGDNHDIAYVFQFYDEDGIFSFTENYDDRVKIVATPIAGATNLNPRGNDQQHTDTAWNVRTFANFDFGGGGWFNVDIWLTEDGGGAQSAADIGFGYYNDFSTSTANFGGIGYTSVFGISSGAPAVFDTDGAGLSWGVYLDSFDPSIDTDGDGIPDGYEEQFFPGDLTQLGLGDFDSDGSTDLEELTNRTDPTNDDSDDDGLLDGVESGTGTFVDGSDTGTDPLVPDTDGDGLSDGAETNSGIFVSATDTGTSPLAADSDGDGFEDLDEVERLFDPTDPGSVPPIPQPVLLAYWNFEGQSEDQSGNGADLSIGGSAVLSPDGDGHLGEGQSLDLGAPNNGAYARSEMGPWLDPAYENNAIAVSFWQYNVQVASTSAFWLHAPLATGGERGFQAHTPWGDGTVYFDQSGCCEGPQRLTIGGVVNVNQWQHFVFQRDTEGNREIWVDGVKVAEAAGGEALDPFNGIITVGSDNTLNNSFGGRIDEMAIFDLPLRPSRIVELAEGAPVGSAPGLDPLGLAVKAVPGGGVELSWNSTLGKFYDVLVSPDLSAPRETWEGLADAMDIAADPSGINTLVIPLPFPEEGFVAVREKNPPPLFSDDLESGGEGWTTVVNDALGNTEWELGVPNGTTGPLAGAGNSASAWCTGLGDYGVDSDLSLRTPAIDLSGVASALLSFDAYRDADGFGDTATIRFLRSSDQSQLGQDVPIDMTIFDVDYTAIEVPVPAAAIGQSVLIEFNFVSDSTLDTFSGLCLDNILVQVP